MSKPRKKRYRNANDIRDKIDWYKTRMQKHNDAAHALEMKARMLAQQGRPDMAGDIHYALSEALRYRKAAARIQEKRLPNLKQKLAEIMTPQLPALETEDKSISA